MKAKHCFKSHLFSSCILEKIIKPLLHVPCRGREGRRRTHSRPAFRTKLISYKSPVSSEGKTGICEKLGQAIWEEGDDCPKEVPKTYGGIDLLRLECMSAIPFSYSPMSRYIFNYNATLYTGTWIIAKSREKPWVTDTTSRQLRAQFWTQRHSSQVQSLWPWGS